MSLYTRHNPLKKKSGNDDDDDDSFHRSGHHFIAGDIESHLPFRYCNMRSKGTFEDSAKEGYNKKNSFKPSLWHKKKITLDYVDPNVEDASQSQEALLIKCESKLKAIETHIKAQTFISSCQSISVLLFFIGLAAVSVLFLMPQISSLTESADQMANASIPIAESAEHVERIAEQVANVTDDVGGAVKNVTEIVTSTFDGVGNALRDFSAGFSGDAGDFLNGTMASIQEAVDNAGEGMGMSLAGLGSALSSTILPDISRRISGYMCSFLNIGCVYAPNSTNINVNTNINRNANASDAWNLNDTMIDADPPLNGSGSTHEFRMEQARYALDPEEDSNQRPRQDINAKSIISNAATSAGNLLVDEEDDGLDVVQQTLARTGQALFDALSGPVSDIWCNMVNCV